jgi:hypothetical protein
MTDLGFRYTLFTRHNAIAPDSRTLLRSNIHRPLLLPLPRHIMHNTETNNTRYLQIYHLRQLLLRRPPPCLVFLSSARLWFTSRRRRSRPRLTPPLFLISPTTLPHARPRPASPARVATFFSTHSRPPPPPHFPCSLPRNLVHCCTIALPIIRFPRFALAPGPPYPRGRSAC